MIRSQSRLLIRRAFKPNAKFKPGLRGLAVKFRPSRAGPVRIQYETGGNTETQSPTMANVAFLD
jgi:hypothetical protein